MKRLARVNRQPFNARWVNDHRNRVTSAQGAFRSRWLAELDQALNAAEHSIRLLIAIPGDRREAALLLTHILTVRAALEEVRLGNRTEIAPDWLDLAARLGPQPRPLR